MSNNSRVHWVRRWSERASDGSETTKVKDRVIRSEVIVCSAPQERALEEQDEPGTAPSKSFISLYQLWSHALPSAYARTAHGITHACGEGVTSSIVCVLRESVIACAAARRGA